MVRAERAELERIVARLAVDSSERVLRSVFCIDVAKAVDPLSPKGFVATVNRLARDLRAASKPIEEGALREAVRHLHVDWSAMTPEERTATIRAANKALLPVEEKVPPKVHALLAVAATRTVRGTRKSVRRRYDLDISVDLSTTDSRIAAHVLSSHTNFVRDELGRRRAQFSRQARAIVAEGLQAGLDRYDIAETLVTRLGEQGFMRSRAYWEVVAAAFSNEARTFAMLGAFDEAGIERYRFEAVLDERTTDICRFMHGRTFAVAGGMSTFDALAESSRPESIKSIAPWVRTGLDAEGRAVLFFKRGDERITVARIERSGFGEVDDVGEFSGEMNASDLESNGLHFPPLHALCRSTVVAV